MPNKCSVDGCNRDSKERGWCHGHYQRWKRNGDLKSNRPLGRRTEGACRVDQCDRSIYARGLCAPHYRRQMHSGDVRADQPIRRDPGDRHISHGYYVVVVPVEMRWLTHGESTCLEHRYVMAQQLGRPLTADESVHHKNGDRLCNEPSNLELWSRWQPRGQRVADKVAWAVEMLRRYRPEMLATGCRVDSLNSVFVPSSGFEPPLPP